uniref:Mitochondrial S-adenosylmethionine carrier protein n=1 Tax=Cebus imitator TaxID=2715852 RepID=A0A2K5Q4F1_CEBIM
IPFSLVQFPLWESLKALWSWRQDHVVDSWQSAVCGAFAGGFAAAVTTPLDVAKTRIMLAKAGSSTASGNVLSALHRVWRSQGLAGDHLPGICLQEESSGLPLERVGRLLPGLPASQLALPPPPPNAKLDHLFDCSFCVPLAILISAV